MPRRPRLQRLFSTYPGGWPGAGLLLLRAAVGVTMVFRGGAQLADASNATPGTWAAGLLAAAAGALLLIGFVTPLVSFLVFLSGTGLALSRFAAPGHTPVESIPSVIYIIVMAAAIALLGPGAFSLDARLFGRREIIIPPASRLPKS